MSKGKDAGDAGHLSVSPINTVCENLLYVIVTFATIFCSTLCEQKNNFHLFDWICISSKLSIVFNYALSLEVLISFIWEVNFYLEYLVNKSGEVSLSVSVLEVQFSVMVSLWKKFRNVWLERWDLPNQLQMFTL